MASDPKPRNATDMVNEMKKVRDETLLLSQQSPGLGKIMLTCFGTVFTDVINGIFTDGGRNLDKVNGYAALSYGNALAQTENHGLQAFVDKNGHNTRISNIQETLKSITKRMEKNTKSVNEVGSLVKKLLSDDTYSDKKSIEFGAIYDNAVNDLKTCAEQLINVKLELEKGFNSANAFLKLDVADAAVPHVLRALTGAVCAAVGAGVYFFKKGNLPGAGVAGAGAVGIAICEIGYMAYNLHYEFKYIRGAVDQYAHLDDEWANLDSDLKTLKTHIDDATTKDLLDKLRQQEQDRIRNEVPAVGQDQARIGQRRVFQPQDKRQLFTRKH